MGAKIAHGGMKNSSAMKVGLVGTGRISDIYLTNCAKFDETEIVACASLDPREASEQAKKFDIPRVLTPQELISDNSIDCVLNLTVPAAHFGISNAALEAGKHVYTEKPFATSLVEAKKLIETATAKGLMIGSAPTRFWVDVGRPSLIDSGVIGEPSGFMAHVGTLAERH